MNADCYGQLPLHAATCLRLQTWKTVDVQFGRNGQYDPACMASIVVTDQAHRLRSKAAEDATLRATTARPLPAAAANGGRVAADPNSKDEILLTEGSVTEMLCEWLCDRCGAMGLPAP